MMKLLIILKQLNTSFKEFIFKRYTLKEEEFENTTYRKNRKGNRTLVSTCTYSKAFWILEIDVEGLVGLRHRPGNVCLEK